MKECPIIIFLTYLFQLIVSMLSTQSIKYSIFENFGIFQYSTFENFGIFQYSTFENFGISAQSAGHKLYYHTWPTPSGKHNYEIDFLLSRKAKICPIEVKSSTSNVHVSIDEFQKKFSARILQRYLLHSKDIRKERDLIMLPMYMAMFL